MTNDEIQYTILNETYDDTAKEFSSIARQYYRIIKKVVELNEDYEAKIHRFELYFSNTIFNKYKHCKHSYVLDSTDTIIIYPINKLLTAREKYDELIEENDDTFNDEFEQMYQEQDLFYMNDEPFSQPKNKEEFKKLCNFIKQEIPHSLTEKKLNKDQKKHINILSENITEAKQKLNFAIEQQINLEEHYKEFMSNIKEIIKEDSTYTFNEENDELIIIQDEDTLKWHLAYLNNK